MPPAPPRSAMSPDELIICEDFLVGHLEYALDLLSSLKTVARCHASGQESCPKSCKGRTCALCALCSAGGLMGTTKAALETYDDTRARLETARASLGKSLPSRAAPIRETLFRNGLAKALFITIVTAGDVLRSEHARWQTRLRDELGSTSMQCPAELDKRIVDLLLLTYTGPRVVCPETNPKSSALSARSAAVGPSESPMFSVFRQCLSADCPCELNNGNRVANAASGGTSIPQVTSNGLSPRDAKKTRTSKAKSMKTGDTSDALAKAKTNAQTERPTYHDPNGPPDTPKPQDGSPHGHVPSGSTSDTALCAQGTESPSSLSECGTLIVDPRVFRLREGVARSDDARRALMAWCRAWSTDTTQTKPKTSPTQASISRDPYESPSVLASDVEPGMEPCTMAVIKDPPHGDDATTVQGLQFDKQEELGGRWLTARQKRCKDRKRRPAGRNLQ